MELAQGLANQIALGMEFVLRVFAIVLIQSSQENASSNVHQINLKSAIKAASVYYS